MKLPRASVILAIVAASILSSVLLGIFLLPRLIDSRFVREKISSELQEKINGGVTLGKIAFRWLPRPVVRLEKTEIVFDDRTRGSIQRTEIYPSVFSLLRGRVILDRAVMHAPMLRIHLAAPAEKEIDLEELEKQMHSALVRLARHYPATRIDASDGSAEINIGDQPPLSFEDVAIQAVASAGELRFKLSGRSNLCERATIEGNVSPDTLAARLAIAVQRLRIKESLALLPLPITAYAGEGEASFSVKMAAVGLRRGKATIDGSLAPFVVVRQGETATIEAKRVKGEIDYGDEVFDIRLEQLELGSPRLEASGELKMRSGLLSALLEVRNADIAEVSRVASRLVDDPDRVERIMRYIPAGRIPELSFQSAGRSLAELVRKENVSIRGSLQNGKVVLPLPDLELQNVSGSVRVADGMLEATAVTATLGATKGWDGKLRLGLDGATAPFRLDISLHTSVPQVHSILLKVVSDEQGRGELLKLRKLEGELSGRLILGERLNALSPVVIVSSANASFNYEPLPFPILIRSGRLEYDQKTIKVENTQGSIGLSNFAGLGITLRRDGSRQIKLESRQMLLDLQQADAWLRRTKARSYFEKLQSVRGQVELSNVALSGAYDHPPGWTFSAAGRLRELEVMHEDYPGPVVLKRGKFDINEAGMRFSDAAANVSDASLSGGGYFEYAHAGRRRIEATGTANLGPQMTQWASRRIELPEEFHLRAPLSVFAERLAWHEGRDISFLGRLTVTGGPQVALELAKRPQALAIQHLSIDDGRRRSRIALQLDGDKADLSFSGEMSSQTIDKIFASFPMKNGSLSGDIQVRATLVDPIRVFADGHLNGNNLRVPIGAERVLVERFSIAASGETVQVRSADVLWDKSRLKLSGKLTGAGEFLRLDLDAAAETLDWEELQRSFRGKTVPQRTNSSARITIPNVQGTIRLKADRFRFEGFDVSPIDTTVAIARAGVRTEIKRGVFCGIDTTGWIEFTAKETRLDLQFSATDAQLEPTTICLTKQQNQITGTYSLAARIRGGGGREPLASTLNGAFQVTARDGEFLRSPGIDATFDYLNATGDFKVPFPDLDRERFPYRFVDVKGRIEGTMLIGDEVNVNSSLINLSGQGRVDLERKQIDGKGLIAVLKPMDDVISRIPVISSIVGGSLVGIPVRVTGSVERPDITYLSPADVGAELLNMPLRILGMPLAAIRLFTPSAELLDKDSAK